jgi:hypothetical protein
MFILLKNDDHKADGLENHHFMLLVRFEWIWAARLFQSSSAFRKGS